ncbi:MAG: amidohydrolase family protein [Candidatus Dormibacteraceae bacterium]
MRIDVHNHAIPPPAVELLRSDPAYRVTVDGDRISGGNHVSYTLFNSFVDPAAKLAELAANRLDAAVVSAAPPVFYYDLDVAAGERMCRAVNEGLCRFCRHRPDRLRWMAHVPMQAPARAVAVLEEARSAGCAGVEVGTSVNGRRLDEDRYEPFWAAAEELGLPVMLHPAYNAANAALDPYYLQNVIGNLLETTVAIERLICAGVLDRHLGLRIVLVHGGGYYPFQGGRLRHARGVRPELEGAPQDPFAYRGRVFADTITHDRQALDFLVTKMGAESVVMGTDLPFDMATADPVGALEEAVGQATSRIIAEENPARLYGFEN